MKVRDFIKINADIDVYDDVCEELGIAFCGPMALTEEGQKRFAEVLDYDIAVTDCTKFPTAIVHVDDKDDKVWKRKLRKAKDFFESAAGYCSYDDFEKWFVDVPFPTDPNDPSKTMIDMCIYCDTTPWFTEAEMEYDNLLDTQFPRSIVREYYKSIGGSDESFVEWVQDICDADSTVGLFQFAVDHGFMAWRDPNGYYGKKA